MAHPIVAGVDTTADSLAALKTAADLAQQSDTWLLAVHVRHEMASAEVGVVAGRDAVALRAAMDEMEAITRAQATAAMAGRPVHWRLDVVAGDPATELLREAVDNDAATIVVGRHHGVVGGLVLGSVAQKLVRKSPISVFVVRDGEAHRVNAA
jgi:nucleotide-binding universal stress UspA family protein